MRPEFIQGKFRQASLPQLSLSVYGQLIGIGGDEEDRTPDLRIANATLSQLSYVPGIWTFIGNLFGRLAIE
jgi:hypothetical protein